MMGFNELASTVLPALTRSWCRRCRRVPGRGAGSHPVPGAEHRPGGAGGIPQPDVHGLRGAEKQPAASPERRERRGVGAGGCRDQRAHRENRRVHADGHEHHRHARYFRGEIRYRVQERCGSCRDTADHHPGNPVSREIRADRREHRDDVPACRAEPARGRRGPARHLAGCHESCLLADRGYSRGDPRNRARGGSRRAVRTHDRRGAGCGCRPHRAGNRREGSHGG